MKIDKTFKIKEKYFNAILKLEKPFELRHEAVEPNSIVKLECENGRYIIFNSGRCILYDKESQSFPYYFFLDNLPLQKYYYQVDEYGIYQFTSKGLSTQNYYVWKWYDTFCWEYINQAQTYLIEIAEILEVK